MLARRTILAAGVAGPVLAACATAPANPDNRAALPPLPHDPHSHARPDEARVLNVSLDLRADFEHKRLAGNATLTIAARPDANEIVLDVDGLEIESVRTNLGETSWSLGEHDQRLGAPLSIAIAPGVETITIAYATGANARALQWLTPEQTSSGKPFLFSQGQAILTRTWAPTQDSPGIRQTYDVRLVAPADLTAVMSAEMLTPSGEPAGEGERAFRFRMTNPVPIYLMSLAIGDLTFGAVGPRTGVWAEPSVLERGLYECADMERMLRVAEALYGPYRWGRYDVLILPPSFPYGGMENPRLTFLTPTFLAGDRSLVSLIAHELAHSWSGNLVTNAVWADGWLNEGFTTYFEGRITEALYGVERANMQNVLAWDDIQRALADTPADATRLHLVGERAGDNTSAIVYEKGALFLRTMERIVGRRRFDAYLRSYFDRHAFGPMTTQWFLADFREHVVRGDAALESALLLDEWAYEPGLPSNAEEPRAAPFERVDNFVRAFDQDLPAARIEWTDWGTYERQRFLQTISRTQSHERLTELEAAFSLNQTGNSEVLFDWLALAVRNQFDPALPALEDFLTRQGRGKFVVPLYRALLESEWGAPIARRIYARARPMYHGIVAARIDRLMSPS